MIFRAERDRQVFLTRLAHLEEDYGVAIAAYVLMGNHFHLVVNSRQGRLAQAMHAFSGSYARWFNYTYERKGALFQGRYDARILDSEIGLQGAGAYVHLNPFHAKLVDHPLDFRWSSLGAYVSGRSPVSWLRLDLLDGRSGEEYLEMVLSRSRVLEGPVDRPVRIDLGSPTVAADETESLTDAYQDFADSDRAVSNAFRASIDEIYSVAPGRTNVVRMAGIVHAARTTDRPATEIAKRYGLRDASGVYTAVRRLAKRASADSDLAAQLARLDLAA